MFKTIYSNQFVTFLFDEKRSYFQFVWHYEDKGVAWESIKESMLLYLNMLFELKPKYLLCDLRDFSFVTNPSQQQWLDENINKTAFEINVVKKALVNSFDNFTNVSLELAMMENYASRINLEYFTTIEEGEKWLFA